MFWKEDIHDPGGTGNEGALSGSHRHFVRCMKAHLLQHCQHLYYVCSQGCNPVPTMPSALVQIEHPVIKTRVLWSVNAVTEEELEAT